MERGLCGNNKMRCTILSFHLLLIWFLAAVGAAYAGDTEFLILPGYVKAGPDVQLPDIAVGDSFFLSAARNEYELFQIAVVNHSGNTLAGEIIFSDWKSENKEDIRKNTKLYRQEFIHISRPSDHKSAAGLYPDALIPVMEKTDIFPGVNLFLIELFVPEAAVPGNYQSRIKIVAGKAVRIFALKLRVWNFNLPQLTSLKTAFGIDFESICEKEKLEIYTPQAAAYFMKYYRLFSEHRISPVSVYPEPEFQEGEVPALDISACDRLWHYCYDKLGFNTLRISFDERMPVDTRKYPLFSEEYNKRVVGYLSLLADYLAKNHWLERAYIHISTVDEPVTAEEYHKSRKFYDLVKKANPEIKYRQGEQLNLYSANFKKYDILDLNLFAYKRAEKKIRVLKNVEIGWYTAVGPKGDFPTYFIDRPLLEPRILCVLNYFYNVKRLAYWNVCWWRQVKDPYNEPLTYAPTPELFANGDGSLIYPAGPKGLTSPVASLRLKMIREGLEDYEYFVLLEKSRGRKYVLKKLKKVIKNLTSFSRNPEDFYRVRQEMGELLDQGVD